MTTIRRITVSQIDGDSANNTSTDEIRPFGETAFYLDNNDKLTLMMFDGARTHLKSKVLSQGILYGSNANSGDGANLDTIRLVPDAQIYDYGSDQYLIVDPTAPNHIHLRAGGTIDNSNAVLYIGGEASNVSIASGSNPPVFVTANNNSWQFGTNGSLTFPDNTVQTTAWNETATNLTTGEITSSTTPGVGSQVTGIRPPDGSNGLGYVWVPDEPQISSLGDITGWTITNSDGIFSTTVVQMRYDLGASWAIETADAMPFSGTYTFTSPDYVPATPNDLTLNAGTQSWILGTDGGLSLPADNVIKSVTPLGGSINFRTQSQAGDPAKNWTITHNGQGALITPYGSAVRSENRFHITSYDTAFENFTNIVDFDTNTYFEFTEIHIVNPQPSILDKIDPASPNNIAVPGTKVRLIHEDNRVYETTLVSGFAENGVDDVTGLIRYSATIPYFNISRSLIKDFGIGISATWEFTKDGSLTLPSGGKITSNTITHELWGTSVQSITLAPVNPLDPNQRLEIYVTEGGEGNHLHLTSGDLSVTDIILGNDSHYFSVSNTGNNFIQAKPGAASTGPGLSAGSGGSVFVTAGNAGTAGDPADGNGGGNVTLQAGVSSAGTGGSIYLNTGNGVTGSGVVQITTDNFLSSWVFNSNGSLTVPGNITSVNNIGVVSGDAVSITSNNTLAAKTWTFDENGSISFPDSTVQTTAWAGGRVVSVPAASTGAAGDLEGDLAFADDYIYYCFADFGTAPTETFTVVNVGEFTNTISVNIAANPNYTIPQAGWFVVIGGVTMTLTAFSGISGSNYNFLFDNPSGAELPSTVTLTSNTGYTNIWKRIAWSGDTW